MEKPKILITIEWFDPAFRAGGPISSIVNLVTDLHKEYDFFIIAGAKDYGEELDDPSLKLNEWHSWKGMAQVFYVSSDNRNRRNIFNLLDDTECDFYYIQGLFSAAFSVYPLIWWKQSKRGQAVMAPRGMLHSTALNVKGRKKKAYLWLVKLFGWYDDVIIHSSNPKESNEIRTNLKRQMRIKEASNLPRLPEEPVKWREKPSQQLRILCVSRISTEKNMLFLAEVLGGLEGNMEATVAGPFNDESYFNEFKQLTEEIAGIEYKYFGEVRPEELTKLYAENDLFVFPSHGENYGHAIVEAMLHGMPCLLGENVPWTGLEENKAGFNLGENLKDYMEKIQYYYFMSAGDFDNARRAAREYMLSHLHLEDTLSAYRELFKVDENAAERD